MSYYDILEVDKHSTKEEIKKQYRKLSLKYHPDRNGNSEESNQQFQNIHDAYCKLLEQEPPNSLIIDHVTTPFQPKDPLIPNIILTVNITLEQSFTGCMLPVEIERWVVEGHTKCYEKETIYVDLYKGIDTNEVIHCKEKGNVLNHTFGDVKIKVHIIPHKDFSRKGLDLIYSKTITLKESLCGLSFHMVHLTGKKYIINSTEDNTIITPSFNKVIKCLGMIRNEHHGNLIIQFNILFPEMLTPGQIETIKQCL